MNKAVGLLKMRIFWYILIIAVIAIFPFDTDLDVKEPTIIDDGTKNNNSNDTDTKQIEVDTNRLFSGLHIPDL